MLLQIKIKKIPYCVAAVMFTLAANSFADVLNTQIPVTINLPVQPLADSLKQFAKQTNTSIAFDSSLAQGKVAPAVKGNFDNAEALRKILSGSGLEAIAEDKTIVIKRERVKTDKPVDIDLKAVQVRAKRFYEVGPLPGLGLTKEEIPGNVQSITAKEIKESHSLSLTDLMNKKLQSVNVNDYQGNPFQMDVTYRGFTAGPQIGTPQGLSVFLDGIRVNEPFGDVVNWDMLPMNAIAGVDVFPGSNPIFGLNTLGGAFTLKTKDGFNNEGVDAEVLTGSYGRKQLQVEGGINNGEFALFGAGNFFMEDGWRDNSPSKVNQLFTKGSYRGEKLDLSLSTLLVQTDLVGNGLLPSEMYARDPSSVFTSPDTTKNKLQQFQLSGAFQVNDSFSITGQVYRRNSDRHQKGADAYTGYGRDDELNRNLDAGDQLTCLYASNNKYNLPDYYVVTLPAASGTPIPDIYAYFGAVSNVLNTDPLDPLYAGYVADPLYQTYLTNNDVKFAVDAFNGTIDLSLVESKFNQDLPTDYLQFAQQGFQIYQNFRAANLYVPQLVSNPPIVAPNMPDGFTTQWAYVSATNLQPGNPYSPNVVDVTTNQNYFYVENKDANGNGNGTYSQNLVITKRAINADECSAALTKLDPSGFPTYKFGQKGGLIAQDPNTGATYFVDGAGDGSGGVVTGIPTAVITETDINQVTDGGSIQLNWNLEHHKLMIGAAIDSASASYGSGQRLGFFDANRKGYLDPDQALDAYTAADVEVRNNDFDGTSITKSLYASETWSPIDTLHVTGAVRYNDTKVKNTIATRSAGYAVLGLHNFISDVDTFNICPAANITPDGKCTGIPTGYKVPDVSKLLNPPETEKFSFYSLNPSLGATWQANPNLNLFGNVAQGTRVPSVIELGCALDKTLVEVSPGIFRYKSVVDNRSCSLPSTLSGDPALPQIKATTYDVGVRGTLTSMLGVENVEWNLGAYRTDLRDDIYMITVADGRNFFDTIGDTRRQGIEAGFGGSVGRARFKLNYALTDATFQNSFDMISNDNSSAFYTLYDDELTGTIKVKKGDRMPGVPLHNLNATVSYDLTDKWSVGLTAVAHSTSFVRGNENNQHQAGVTREIWLDPAGVQVPANTPGANLVSRRLPSNNPGKVPGYATFNLQSSYRFNKEWTVSMLINNLFDKEYFSAGRLGRNPFSLNAAGNAGNIGVDGYNHNSNNWLSTNFIAAGAPRGVWFSLNWQFDAGKK